MSEIQKKPRLETRVDLQALHGVLVVDKPDDKTSTQVLNDLKWMLKRAGVPRKQLPKVGHGGTLDPFATGVLVVLFGQATRFATDFLGGDKVYEATLRLGMKSSTGDVTGELETCASEDEVLALSNEEILRQAESFCVGTYWQVPPMFSAKQKNGQRLYKLARKGREVERDPVPCTCRDFEMFGREGRDVHFRLRCSAGTFIRVFGEDLAKALGTEGFLLSLRRLACGPKSLTEAVPYEQMEYLLKSEGCWSRLPSFFHLGQLLSEAHLWTCPEDELKSLSHGDLAVIHRHQAEWPATAQRVMMMREDRVLAVVENDHGRWSYKCVLFLPEDG